MTMESSSINTKKKWIDALISEKTAIITAFISLLSIILIGLIFVFFGDWSFSTTINEDLVSKFGNFIGGVIGTLLAFVAAILYYIALKAQREDIAINQQSMQIQTSALQKQIEEFEKQKEELELTRKVYEQQYKTMVGQERIMKIQQFESNFYSLLNVYIAIKSELNNSCSDKDYFKEKFEEIQKSYTTGWINNTVLNCHIDSITSYVSIFHLHQGQLAHYFKTIYRLIKIVDSNLILNDSEKISYVKIIRSQLTDHEQLLMYYNYHSVYGEKSKQLIYKYNLLKHVHTIDKVDFNYKYSPINKKNNIIAFTNWLNTFIEKSINIICEFDNENEIIEDKWDSLRCAVSIINTDELIFRINCFDEDRLPDNFPIMIYDYIYDRIFTSQFIYITDGILYQSKRKIDGGGVTYDYILNSDKIRTINIDKF